MIKKYLLLIGILAVAGSLNAQIIAYDGFGGLTPDVAIASQTSGGTGWGTVNGGEWYDINSSVLPVPNSDQFVAQAGSLSNGAYAGTGLSSTPGSTYFKAGPGIGAHNVAYRNMATNFTGNSGGTFYFSYLVSGTAWDTNVARLMIQDDSASGRRIEIQNGEVGGGGGNKLMIETGGNPGGNAGNPQITTVGSSDVFDPSGGTYFIVGKVTLTSGVDSPIGPNNGTSPFPYNTFNGEDLVQVAIFSDTDTVGLEPGSGSWDLEAVAYWNDDINFDSIALVSSVVEQYAFDEIRVGTSWADVTAVPEPSTYALMFGFLALGLVMWRRQRVK